MRQEHGGVGHTQAPNGSSSNGTTKHDYGIIIAAKELIPIIVAAVIWGKQWKGSKVVAQCASGIARTST